MTSSHYFVLTIPASETSPVIYMTAPTEAEVGQTYKRIDEVLKSFCFRWTIWHCFLSFSVPKCLRRWVLAAIKEFSRNPICRFIGRTPLLQLCCGRSLFLYVLYRTLFLQKCSLSSLKKKCCPFLGNLLDINEENTLKCKTFLMDIGICS